MKDFLTTPNTPALIVLISCILLVVIIAFHKKMYLLIPIYLLLTFSPVIGVVISPFFEKLNGESSIFLGDLPALLLFTSFINLPKIVVSLFKYRDYKSAFAESIFLLGPIIFALLLVFNLINLGSIQPLVYAMVLIPCVVSIAYFYKFYGFKEKLLKRKKNIGVRKAELQKGNDNSESLFELEKKKEHGEISNMEYYFNKGSMLFYAGQFKDSITTLEDAIKAIKEEGNQNHYNQMLEKSYARIAEAKFFTKNLAEAIHNFEEALNYAGKRDKTKYWKEIELIRKFGDKVFD